MLPGQYGWNDAVSCRWALVVFFFFFPPYGFFFSLALWFLFFFGEGELLSFLVDAHFSSLLQVFFF